MPSDHEEVKVPLGYGHQGKDFEEAGTALSGTE